MAKKPTYEELEQRVKELEKEAVVRKRAREALRDSEEKWHSLVENAPGFIIEVNRYGKIQFINRGVPGIGAKEAIGQSMYKYIEPAYQNTARETIKEVFKTGKPRSYVVKALGPDGHHLAWYETQVGPIRHGTRVVAATLITTDITDRKRVEEALRDSEERLRQIVQNMPVMLDALDEDNRILVWNRECERVTGYTPEEMIGVSNVLEILYPDKEYLSRLLAEWAERGDEFYNWEMDLTCKGGRVRTVAWYNISKRFPIPGWKSWAIGVDVSERKQAEEALRRERDTLQEALAKIKVLSEWYASYLRSV